MKSRNLKIEATGDFCYGKIKPKIRLTGHWLERAGFKPGNRVAVQISGLGILTLRSVSAMPDTDNNSLQPNSATLPIFGDLL
jgi:hypothetical protein